MRYLPVRYVQEVVDRYGKARLYFRRQGWPRVKLEGLPGSREFQESYSEALKLGKVEIRPGASRIIPGSIADLLAKYYASAEFKALEEKTQKNYRLVLEKLRPMEHLPVKLIKRKDILALRDKDNSIALIKRVKTLLTFAVERDFRDDNPADKVKPAGKRKPFRAWTDKDIARFLAHYADDSRQNLAITLLLYTGARRSDIVTFGWHNITGNILSFVPRKTSHTQKDNPKRLLIPVHSVLMARIKNLPKEDPAFLMTEYGKPMSEAGFTNWFSESAAKAKLPANSTPHGLRKAASRRLAEAGCSASQIAAITGHSTLKEVERYTASADQAKLARSAMRLIESKPKKA